MENQPTQKPKTGWKVAGVIFAILTVLLVLVALLRLPITLQSTGNEAYDAGKIFGALILPITTGLLAVFCFRKAK